MKRLMLDEMISPSLVTPLWEAGVDTIAVLAERLTPGHGDMHNRKNELL